MACSDTQALDLVVAGGLVRYTELTHTTVGSLSSELAQIREAGFAVDWGEWRAEVRGVAAPIVDSSLQVVAALGVCGPSNRLTGELVYAIAPAVIDIATRLSIHLGAPESELHAACAAMHTSSEDRAQPDEAAGPEIEERSTTPSRQHTA